MTRVCLSRFALLETRTCFALAKHPTQTCRLRFALPQLVCRRFDHSIGFFRAALLAFLAFSGNISAYDMTRLSGVESPRILGVQSNGTPSQCSMSDDGSQIAFVSTASNLVSDDANGVSDIFLDTGAGLIRASFDLASMDVPWSALAPSLSENGRYIVYERPLQRLPWGIGPGSSATLRYDRVTQTTVGVSPDPDGTGFYLAAENPKVSDNGRYVVMSSGQSLDGTLTGSYHVYRFDTQTQSMLLVSKRTNGTLGNGDSRNAWISGDGDVIAFESDATNLVVGDTNAKRDIFVHVVSLASTTRVSVRSNGAESDNDSFMLDISNDGNMVLFRSDASNLDTTLADTNGFSDLYRHNRTSATTRRASLDSANQQFTSATTNGAISGDGQFVVFSGTANVGGVSQVWRKNMLSDVLLQVSNTAAGASNPDVSEDGLQICFIGGVRTFVDMDPTDANGKSDLYRASISTAPIAVTVTREGERTAGLPSSVTSEPPLFLDMDDSGRRVLYQTPAAQVDTATFAAHRSGTARVYVLDTASKLTFDLCGPTVGISNNDQGCSGGALSGDGNYAFFKSSARDLHPDTATTLFTHFYRRNLSTGAIDLISRNTAGAPSVNAASIPGVVAANFDGSRFVFHSFATDLVLNDSNNVTDAFLWDASTGIRRLSVTSAGVQANAESSGNIAISNDGSLVVFPSIASNLVAGDTNGKFDLFLYTLANNSLQRIAQPLTGQSSENSSLNAMSMDGRYFSVSSEAPEFPSAADGDLFLWDRTLNSFKLVGSDLLSAGALGISGVRFRPNVAEYYYSVADRVNYPTIPNAIYLQLIGEPQDAVELLRAPADVSLEVPPKSVGVVAVYADGNALASANYSVDNVDNNGVGDLFELQSGLGYAVFDAPTLSVAESAGALAINVSRIRGQATVGALNTLITNGGAVQNSDFTVPVNGLPFVWDDGVSGTQTKIIQIVNDSAPEGNESFTLALNNPASIYLGTPSVLTITIIDDDAPIFANGFE
jgi:hypothetical protein